LPHTEKKELEKDKDWGHSGS
jgi:hypothetical protein